MIYACGGCAFTGVKVGQLSWKTSRGERPVTDSSKKIEDHHLHVLYHYSASISFPILSSPPSGSFLMTSCSHTKYMHCVCPLSSNTRPHKHIPINARSDSVSRPELFILHHLLLFLYCKVTQGISLHQSVWTYSLIPLTAQNHNKHTDSTSFHKKHLIDF